MYFATEICMNVLFCKINNSQFQPYRIRVFFWEIPKTFVKYVIYLSNICQLFVKYENICQICKIFVKYVNYWMQEMTLCRMECILSCFLNIGRSKILDLKEAQIGLIFLHKWNGMDWRFFNEEEKCDIGTVDLLSWNILQIYTNYMFSCISSLL